MRCAGQPAISTPSSRDRPGIGPLDAHDQRHDGGFAGAVRTDQPDDFAGPKIEADVLDGDDAAKALVEFADLQTYRAGHSAFAPVQRVAEQAIGKEQDDRQRHGGHTKVLSWPSGRRNSLATIRNTAPSAAPRMVRRPPSTAAMMI